MKQRTIAEKVSCRGVGLHCGERVELGLFPARAGAGIHFVRTDLPDAPAIPAAPAALASTRNATTLACGSARVATVEHLLAALLAQGIDNARVEIDGPELPILDGSAAPFADLIRRAGVYEQREPRGSLRVSHPVEIADGERWIRVEPAERLQIHYAIRYAHPAIGRQEIRLDRVDAEVFRRELAPARTFGFLGEVGALWQQGLGRGGSLENALLLDAERVLNPGGLRFPDEFARHKALDLLGDLALLGVPLLGRVRVECGGHALHQRLVAALAGARAAPARLPAGSPPPGP